MSRTNRPDQAPQYPAASAQAEEPGAIDLTILASFKELQEPGAPDVVSEFIDLFLGDLPSRRIAIRLGIAREDMAQVQGAAHALKASAGYIGALHLARCCQRLEHSAGQRDRRATEAASEAVEREATRAEAMLRQHRATRDEAPLS